MNSLGEQSASRKRRPFSYTPGAWCGKLLHTNRPYPVKAVLQKKWKQVRKELLLLKEAAQSSSRLVSYELLRSVTGRAMNQAEVYYDVKPYYKSFYNCLNAWRPGRDVEGWRLPAGEFDVMNEREEGGDHHAHPPRELPMTREMERDVDALLEFYCTDEPVVLPVRPSGRRDVAYLGGDASAAGHGAGIQYPDGTVEISIGRFTAAETARGSNWREATNLARKTLRVIRGGRLDGFELWMVTDNLVWSYITKKGMSSKRGLSDLVREIRKECLKRGIFLHPIHVSGDRMIRLGFDGLSRGDLDSGLMLGHDLRDLVPVGSSAFDVAGAPLMEWTKWWMADAYVPPLSYEGWYTEGHKAGCHLWTPPPGGALIALEEIAQAKLKRPFEVLHVMICPRLLYFEEWERRFAKEMDFWMIIPTNSSFWPHNCCEPLVLGISFPLRHSPPWKLRRVATVVELGRSLQKMFESGDLGAGDILRQFWLQPWGFLGL